MSLIIGSHVSFTKDKQLIGSVNEALSYGANTFMFYMGAPQNTRRSDINNELTNEAFKIMHDNNIKVEDIVVHAPYIINLANRKSTHNAEFAVNFLKSEIKKCDQMGIKQIVLHPGSHVGAGEEVGINNIVQGLNEVIEPEQKVLIALETMAGKGSECGKTFHELKKIIDGVKYQDKLSICMDTCHLHDGGYDIGNFDQVLAEFDEIIGLDKLTVIHINDSKNEKGSHKDRHENIGYGEIGYEKLLKIIYHPQLKGIPKILETPYITASDDDNKRVYPPYKYEIEMIKNKKFKDFIDIARIEYQK